MLLLVQPRSHPLALHFPKSSIPHHSSYIFTHHAFNNCEDISSHMKCIQLFPGSWAIVCLHGFLTVAKITCLTVLFVIPSSLTRHCVRTDILLLSLVEVETHCFSLNVFEIPVYRHTCPWTHFASLQVTARRKEDTGKMKVLLHWTPEDMWVLLCSFWSGFWGQPPNVPCLYFLNVRPCQGLWFYSVWMPPAMMLWNY